MNKIVKKLYVGTAVAAFVGSTFFMGRVSATPGHNVVSAPMLASGSLDDAEFEIKWRGQAGVKVEGAAEVKIQKIRIAAGGTAGWHTHPGPAIVIVTEGTLDLHTQADPCVGEPFSAGETFVDYGGGFVHTVNNTSNADVEVHVVYFLPAGAPSPRIDAAAPPAQCD